MAKGALGQYWILVGLLLAVAAVGTLAATARNDGLGRAQAEPAEDVPEVVVLARSDELADALTAGPMAGRLGAPVLVTPQDQLLDVTADALRDADPDVVILAGGTGALSEAVEDAVNSLGYATRRVSGSDRHETAVLVTAALEEYLPEGGGHGRAPIRPDPVEPAAQGAAGPPGGMGVPIVLEGSTGSVGACSDGKWHAFASRCGSAPVELSSVVMDGDHFPEGAQVRLTSVLTVYGGHEACVRIIRLPDKEATGSACEQNPDAGDATGSHTTLQTQPIAIAPGPHRYVVELKASVRGPDVAGASLTMATLTVEPRGD